MSGDVACRLAGIHGCMRPYGDSGLSDVDRESFCVREDGKGHLECSYGTAMLAAQPPRLTPLQEALSTPLGKGH